jgi:hypothetical protein
MTRACDGLRLYVYERPLTKLPCDGTGANKRYFSNVNGQCRCSASTSAIQELVEDGDTCGLRGPQLELPRELDPSASAFKASHPMSLAHVVHSRSLNHRCRVHDPALADLFFVPLYTLERVRRLPPARRPGPRTDSPRAPPKFPHVRLRSCAVKCCRHTVVPTIAGLASGSEGFWKNGTRLPTGQGRRSSLVARAPTILSWRL